MFVLLAKEDGLETGTVEFESMSQAREGLYEQVQKYLESGWETRRVLPEYALVVLPSAARRVQLSVEKA